MNGHEPRICVRVDRYTRVCLTVIAVLLTVLILGLWADAVPAPRPGAAADPVKFGDASKQRDDMLTALTQTHQKLDELVQLFKSGEAKVSLAAEKGKN